MSGARRAPRPWHEVVRLRDDLKSGELSLAVFAADLFDVVMQQGRRPVYERPAEFFALTYPTFNLRELVKEVALRLAGRSDRAYRRLAVNYGGGKTHTLIALRHLAHDPDALPDLPALREFEAHAGFKAPRARVAALCFDKIDLEKGVASLAPDGTLRTLRQPWSVLAWQLAGAEGLRLLHADGRDAERETPPAEPLMAQVLARPQAEGLATLVLLDEVLMYLRAQVEADPRWRGRLLGFFQYLTQAVVKTDRCALVASLLASDPRANDDLGGALLRDVSEVFGRQREEDASPVSKEDVAQVLRRRFFTPESIRDQDAFRPHAAAAVAGIAALDERTAKERKAAEQRYLHSFPLHPDLTEIFYTRWTQIDGFQRTRGILRTFAIALRDAESWDTSPLIGPGVFLAAPGADGLAEAAGELAASASVESGAGAHQAWRPILEGELAKARALQAGATRLAHRELEQAVVAVFLSCQPVSQKALTPDLLALLGAGAPDRIELQAGLLGWTEVSWFLDETETAAARGPAAGAGGAGAGGAGAEAGGVGSGGRRLPAAWRLGNRPNLRQMHHDACRNRVPPELVEARLLDAVARQRSLTSGAAAAGAAVHNLPARPRDVADDGAFHYVVLGPQAASDPGRPSPAARRFLEHTTTPERPRVYRNAVLLAVPSRDGLDAARDRVREYLGWEEVRAQLREQPIDPLREQMLAAETAAARARVPDAVRAAWCVVVTVAESGAPEAFRVVVGAEPLFTAIKAERRARIQETAINAQTLLPGGPYDLWREDEQARRVSDLTGAFGHDPRLPKMLRTKEILDTVADGVEAGVWVAQVTGPDRAARTFWRTPIDERTLADPALELLLPGPAALGALAPGLLRPGALPGLWTAETITVAGGVRLLRRRPRSHRAARRVRGDRGDTGVRPGANRRRATAGGRTGRGVAHQRAGVDSERAGAARRARPRRHPVPAPGAPDRRPDHGRGDPRGVAGRRGQRPGRGRGALPPARGDPPVGRGAGGDRRRVARPLGGARRRQRGLAVRPRRRPARAPGAPLGPAGARRRAASGGAPGGRAHRGGGPGGQRHPGLGRPDSRHRRGRGRPRPEVQSPHRARRRGTARRHRQSRGEDQRPAGGSSGRPAPRLTCASG